MASKSPASVARERAALSACSTASPSPTGIPAMGLTDLASPSFVVFSRRPASEDSAGFAGLRRGRGPVAASNPAGDALYSSWIVILSGNSVAMRTRESASSRGASSPPRSSSNVRAVRLQRAII